MSKAVVLEKVGKVAYREITSDDVYKPTAEEEELHGMKVVALSGEQPLGDDQVEVKAVLGAVCTHEVSVFLGDLTYPKYPMPMGHEAVHKVLRVGSNVKHLKPGDYCACCWYHGQWSEKITGPASSAYKLPDNLGDAANWVIEPAASIVNAVGYMDIKPGDRVLLIGAGFMGLLMIQLIHGYPASELVVCDIKESNRKLAKECGADTVVDSNGVVGMFDKVIECTGSQPGLDSAVSHCAKAGEIYLFGWHRKQRTIDFKLEHLMGHKLIHTSPAIDDGRVYERYWPITIKLFEKGVFDLSKLISHKYKASEIEKCMADSVERKDGFVKSVFYLGE